MEKFELQAQARSEQSPKNIRNDGMIPAIVYGQDKATEHISVPYAAFEKVFRKAGESTIITLNVEGKEKNVLIQDTQRHYLNNKFLHADFYEVSMTEKLTAHVPLEFVGVSKSVKENAGVLITVLNEIEVECLPADLPHALQVDISVLQEFNDSIHVRDIPISDKVTVLTAGEEVVATVKAPRTIEEELSAPVVEDVSKVEGAAEEKPVAAEGEGKEASDKKEEKSK